MIHTLPYQSDELLKESYFKLRKIINPTTDIIHLTLDHRHIIKLSKEEIYKKALYLEGIYRSENNGWIQPLAKLRVIKKL